MRPSPGLAIITITVLAVPCPAFAQREAFVEGLVAFTAALSGTYGDEGAQARSALDTMTRALTEWDRSLRENAETVASRLPAASPQQALEMHTTMGALFLERGRLNEAAREFQAASVIAPGRAALLVFQAVAHEAAKEPLDAVRAFRRAWEIDPNDPVTGYWVAQHSLRDNRTEEAAHPLATLSAAARRMAAQERPPRAEPFIDVSLVQDEASSTPLFAPAAYQQGYALIEQYAYLDALNALRAAASNDRFVTAAPSSRMTQGAAALRNGRIAEATRIFAGEIAAEPRGSEAHRMLGVTYWAAGEYEKSIEHLENAVRLNPNDERARIALARVFAEAGQPSRAEQALVETVRVLPASALAHRRLGTMYALAARNQDAIRELEAAVSLSALGGKAQIYRELGILYRRESDIDAEVRALSRLIRIAQNDPSAHTDRGKALLLQGRQDEAFIEFVAALLANPEYHDAYLAIGQMHLAAGRYPDAVLALQRAVALNGNNVEARYALGTALIRSGQREAGAKQLAEFQRLQTQEVEAHRRQIDVAVLKLEADTRNREGEHERAITLWQAIVTAQPDVTSNHLGLAAALAQHGRLDAAVEHYEKALALDAAPQAYRQLAALYDKMGRFDESARTRARLQRMQQEALGSGNLPR